MAVGLAHPSSFWLCAIVAFGLFFQFVARCAGPAQLGNTDVQSRWARVSGSRGLFDKIGRVQCRIDGSWEA